MAQFEKFYIEISDYCGLNCTFCPSHSRKSVRGAMQKEVFESICRQIEGKTKRACFQILGDPLSVKNFEDYTQIAHSYHLKIDLVTTGLFLKERHFELLLQEPFVQVSFSLSAFLANPLLLHTSHLYRILSFCEACIHANSPIFINLRLHQNDILQKSRDFNMILESIRSFFGLSAYVLEQFLAGRDIRIKLAPKIFLNATRSFSWEQEDIKKVDTMRGGLDSHNQVEIESKDCKIFKDSKTQREEKNPRKPLCYGAIKQCGVLSNGELVPCCIDYKGKASFGNVKEQSIKNILESPSFKGFRHLLKEGIAPCDLCKNCGYKDIL
ncbi:radical SAM/SPASM domain-containing protein [Helicobacter typhlonius]|uniref:radical SAM/SPASM domain-containing protein n=1 Tax=Helicobacter typhlonius TaxID=76936 RepID=UPI002FE315FD